MMEEVHFWTDTIIKVATIISAILVIVQSFTKYNPLKGIRSWLTGPLCQEIEGIKKKVETLDWKQDELRKDQLKLVIVSDSIPMAERLKAGKVYVEELGGNGAVSVQYSILKKDYERKLKGETE